MMLEIRNDYSSIDLMDFLSSVPSVKDIEEDVLKNACVALEDNKIVGCISYEIYSSIGLIRYFVVKKGVSSEIVDSLIISIIDKARKNNIIKLISFTDSEDVIKILSESGFKKIDKKIYFNEENVKKTSFAKSIPFELSL